jgi:hypothetical protein
VYAVFVELPAFARYRDSYLDDAAFVELQQELMKHPTAGDMVEGAGGLRKVRFRDGRRGKGKRGGLRVIYYWWDVGHQFWLFTLYGKNEADDLTPAERGRVKMLIKAELKARRAP